MKRKNYKAITALMIGTFLTAGTIAACASQSEAAPTQAITSSQELMASGAKSASVPVETTARTTDGGSASKAAPAPASAADIPSQPASAKDIGEAAAKQIALEHAGIAEADASYLWVSRDYDDGRLEYEVEFFSGSKEYDYDIDAADGSILSFDSETEFAGKKTAGSERISLEQAKKTPSPKYPAQTIPISALKRTATTDSSFTKERSFTAAWNMNLRSARRTAPCWTGRSTTKAWKYSEK